jgi:hypothetical protein
LAGLIGGGMSRAALKERLIDDIKGLPYEKVKEVANFINFLNLKEDDWFIDYVNKRGIEAKADRKKGRRFTSLEELQKEFK